MAQEYKTLHPGKYYRDYLSQGIRPDGREFDKFRPIIVNLGSIDTADGSAIAKIGDTTVICGIKAELCKPKPDTPNNGFLVPNLELPPLCSPKFKSGPPSDQAQVLTQLIADIITNSGCIDLQSLCIFPDKLAWCLYIDFICLNFDGAVVDASIIALISSLKTVKLPMVEYDAAIDNIQVNLEARKPLNILSIPISTTFVVFDDKIILTDPTSDEESLCTGSLVIAVKDEEICCIHKPGGTLLTEENMQKCIEKSKERVPHIKQMIEAALQCENTSTM